MEQEATILRTKTHDLEAENEKMMAENRRLHLRVSRKGAPTDPEKLMLDKLELEERIKALEKKLAEIPTKGSAAIASAGSPRLSRPSGRLSPSDGPETSVLRREKEILEKDVKSKEDQIDALKARVEQLEKDRDAKAPHKIPQRVPKKPVDTMTKLQLKVLSSLFIEYIRSWLAANFNRISMDDIRKWPKSWKRK